MKQAIYLLILGITLPLIGFAQKEKRSTGEFQVNVSRSDFSEREACDFCLEQARVQAIEKVFGTVIVQGNTTLIRNTQTGETVETEQEFNMMAETYVNGDWIRTIDESWERFTADNGEFWVRCKAKGIVRELSQPRLSLDVQPLDCLDANCTTTRFKDGDPLYLYFKSPESGYLTVYLADDELAQRIFPYREMPRGMEAGVPVEADKSYILFSRSYDEFDLRSYVDEYELYAASDRDLNRLYVIYSNMPLRKPGLNTATSGNSDYEMPPQLDLEDFQRWMAENRRFQNGFQMERIDLTIEKTR